MIAFLKGRILGLNLETAILDVGGVGYEVHCPLNVISELQNAKERAEIQSLFVYTNVREDAIQLFGFLTALEKDFFLTLLKVNGIGPKNGSWYFVRWKCPAA